MAKVNNKWVEEVTNKMLSTLEANVEGISISTLGSELNLFEPNLSWILKRLEESNKVRIIGYSPTWSITKGVGVESHYALV